MCESLDVSKSGWYGACLGHCGMKPAASTISGLVV
jgi:hypothetical protein